MTVFVKPKSTILDGNGCVWEYLLAMRGFNDLPDDKKVGRVVAAYTDGTLDIHFDSIDYTAKSVFSDEVSLVMEIKECSDCKRKVPRHEWIQMGKTKDKKEICNKCFSKHNSMLY